MLSRIFILCVISASWVAPARAQSCGPQSNFERVSGQIEECIKNRACTDSQYKAYFDGLERYVKQMEQQCRGVNTKNYKDTIIRLKKQQGNVPLVNAPANRTQPSNEILRACPGIKSLYEDFWEFEKCFDQYDNNESCNLVTSPARLNTFFNRAKGQCPGVAFPNEEKRIKDYTVRLEAINNKTWKSPRRELVKSLGDLHGNCISCMLDLKQTGTWEIADLDQHFSTNKGYFSKRVYRVAEWQKRCVPAANFSSREAKAFELMKSFQGLEPQANKVIQCRKALEHAVDRFLPGEIEDLMNLSRGEPVNGPNDYLLFIEQAKGAIGLADTVLSVFPGNKTMVALRKKAEEALKKADARSIGPLYASDFHRKNVGKVFFSEQPILPGKEDPKVLKTSFTANGTIYGIAYFSRALPIEVGHAKEEADQHVYFKVLLDKEKKPGRIAYDRKTKGSVGFGGGKLVGNVKGKAYYVFELYADSKGSQNVSSFHFARGLWTLPAGNHQLYISVQSNDYRVQNGVAFEEATAVFSVDATGDRDGLKQRYYALADKWMGAVRMTKSGKRGKSILPALVKMAKEGYAPHEKVLRTVVTSDDWDVTLNIAGVPIYREVYIQNAYTVDEEKLICVMSSYRIKENYQGRGKYGPPFSDGIVPDETEILCKNVNK